MGQSAQVSKGALLLRSKLPDSFAPWWTTVPICNVTRGQVCSISTFSLKTFTLILGICPNLPQRSYVMGGQDSRKGQGMDLRAFKGLPEACVPLRIMPPLPHLGLPSFLINIYWLMALFLLLSGHTQSSPSQDEPILALEHHRRCSPVCSVLPKLSVLSAS